MSFNSLTLKNNLQKAFSKPVMDTQEAYEKAAVGTAFVTGLVGAISDYIKQGTAVTAETGAVSGGAYVGAGSVSVKSITNPTVLDPLGGTIDSISLALRTEFQTYNTDSGSSQFLQALSDLITKLISSTTLKSTTTGAATSGMTTTNITDSSGTGTVSLIKIPTNDVIYLNSLEDLRLLRVKDGDTERWESIAEQRTRLGSSAEEYFLTKTTDYIVNTIQSNVISLTYIGTAAGAVLAGVYSLA